MGLVWKQGVLFTLLFALALPAHAVDPILMFLLSFARNIIERQVEESLKRPLPPSGPVEPMPDLGKVYPGTTVEPVIVRRLIDDSFIYLSAEQRKEIFDSLNKALLDPKTLPVRGEMIEHFARRALAVRAAQVRLSQLAPREKQMMAEEFKREIASVPDADLVPLLKVLEQGLLPVPSDLNQLFLTQLEARPGIALAARPRPVEEVAATPALGATPAPAAPVPAAAAAPAPAAAPAADSPAKPAEPAATTEPTVPATATEPAASASPAEVPGS
jgi:hypothetical protein